MTDAMKIKNILIRYRDSAVHASRNARKLIEDLIAAGEGTSIKSLTCYRVCDENDIVFKDNTANDVRFLSTCETINAAKSILERPPNPFADRIVEIELNDDVVFRMPYDDQHGSSKSSENEIIITKRSAKVKSVFAKK